MPARLAVVVIATITMAGGAACSAERGNDEGGTVEVVLDETSASEVMLYVSNQSFEDSEVGIDVKIGGKTVVDRNFDVGNQHNWIPFLVRLAPGEHTLEASSSTGATYSATFDVGDPATRYAVLDYWYHPSSDGASGATPRGFTFMIQDDPIGFA